MYPIIQYPRFDWLARSLTLCLLIAASPAMGQIVPDNTLPVNSTVTRQNNTNVINGGTVAGSNLFHSFQQFSVPNGGTAFFNNDVNIQNIVTRVTGREVSNINGLLQTRGSANLFLLNPNGIIFGSNAALDISGSFVASTASSIKFADGNEFSAVNPQNTSLLSIAVPLGLQFPGVPANIINRGANLSASSEKTIALVGGDVTLEGGQLTAAQGRIELGSVGANSLVNLNSTPNTLTLGYAGVNNFGNIQLLSGSTVSANDFGRGNIQVQGGRVTLSDRSKITAEASGNQNGGEIFVKAKDLIVTNGSEISVQTSNVGNAGTINVQADRVEVSGISADGQVFSTIAAGSMGSGNSGSVNITTNRLIAKDGGDVSVTTFKSGEGGNLTVNASEVVELIGAVNSPDDQNFSRSGLFAATEGTGKGGSVTINTPKLRVLDGARVSVSTRGKGQDGTPGGQGGNLFVRGQEIELGGTSADGRFPSGLFALSGEVRPDPNIDPKQATGRGGNIDIETGQLIIRDGAQVSADTAGIGKGGNINVVADAINITGGSVLSKKFSTLAANSNGAGDSGNITIQTRQLRASDGGDVSVTAFGNGKSGELTVSAKESIELIGASAIPNTATFSRSGLFAATEGTKEGGSLTVNTPQLTIKDGARISVSTRRSGKGGNLTVNADRIDLSGVGEVQLLNNGKIETRRFASGLFALSGEERPYIRKDEATGQGGDLKINTGSLNIRDGAQVSADTAGIGKGGNINVVADTINITGGSAISKTFSTLAANSNGEGDSGNITIQTRQLRASDGGDISVTAFGTGKSGTLTVSAKESIELIGASAIPNTTNFSRSGLFAATEGTKEGGSLTVNTPQLTIKDGARISVSTRRSGKGGNLTVNADRIDLSGVGEVQLLNNGKIETRRFASGLFALSGEVRPNIREDEATGQGGDLKINTGSLNIRDRAQVSVNASGLGAAGSLEVKAGSIKLENGSITGQTLVQGNGANITLQVQDSLLLRGNSQISTNARADNGGNITIAADALAILNNSNISANAGRQGGNVKITTQGLFALPGSITATSARGPQFDGVITINTLNPDSSQGLVDVPENFLAPENQVASGCAAQVGQDRNQLIVTGRGGLPPSATEPLSSETVRVSGTGLLSPDENSLKLPRPATGLLTNAKGQIVLTAGNFTDPSSRIPTANCHVR